MFLIRNVYFLLNIFNSIFFFFSILSNKMVFIDILTSSPSEAINSNRNSLLFESFDNFKSEFS